MTRAIVVVGPLNCYARARDWLAVGPMRPYSELHIAEREADAMDALFSACPPRQWPAAAQAAMGVKL